MNGRCETCKWWEMATDPNRPIPEEAHDANYRQCVNGVVTDGLYEDCPRDDGSLVEAMRLLTGPRFGCIHHEAPSKEAGSRE